MTYYITAMTNNKAKLIVKTAQVSNDKNTADAIGDMWEAEGYIVSTRCEG